MADQSSSAGEPTRRKALALPAVDPRTGKIEEVFLHHQRLLQVAKRGTCQIMECRILVPEVLAKPAAIFAGLREDEDEDRYGFGWLCYCKKPSRAFTHDGREKEPYPGQVYLVFVNTERVAYCWRWEQADEDDDNLPIRHETRFRRKVI